MGGRGCCSLAARSGRGGTTGRAMGCPARGRCGGAPGCNPAGRGGGATGTPGRTAGAGAPGRGELVTEEPGVMPVGGICVAPGVAVEGRGARGPESTWPGLGAAGGMGRGGGGVGREGAAGAAGVRGRVGRGAVGSGGRGAPTGG